MIFGYARVSTTDQNLDAQLDALKGAGVERIFQEKITGSTRVRPELDALLQHVRKDDVVVVTKLDRLARSLTDLLELVTTLKDRGVGFRSLGESIDTTTPTGRLIFHVFGSLAEFERERIVERTREGLASARRRGRVGGRPGALNQDQRAEVRQMRELGRPIGEIAHLFKVSVSTVRRA
jgi:DNA invertase Pin-like site-specific DNA recombinase